MYPRIYLAIDNCYGYKRFTEPADWMRRSLSCGYTYIEASADTEADPLYMGNEYMKNWTREVRRQSEITGAKVANLYSGHGTYTTLGLAHPDAGIRNRFIDDWFGAMVDASAEVGAGLGFYAHGFMNDDIQSPESYARKVDELYDSLARIARRAKDRGVEYVSLENMYTPHMYPWTLKTAEDTLKGVYARADYPMYLTVDVGHMAGQKRFLKPHINELTPGTWVGTERAHRLLHAGDVQGAIADMDKNPQLFADSTADSDPYEWLRRFGCYSPIIHMQQTDNNASAHHPFTAEYNKTGIINLDKVLSAIKESYDAEAAMGMPPKCQDIFLTVEVFCGTMDSPYALLDSLSESAEWMRQGIPEDGMTLDALC